MSVSIKPFQINANELFLNEKHKIEKLLTNYRGVHHIGSTAVPGLGGKNIIDILISAQDIDDITRIRDALLQNGYYLGNSNQPESGRLFLASRKEETGEGDFHIHIAVQGSSTHDNFLILRDFLRANPDEAKIYYQFKQKIAKQTSYQRELYKQYKSEYVSKLIAKAKN